MSTRSVIARVGEHEGQFSGRYVHADGYPTGMGPTLWGAVHGHFKNDLSAMLVYLIDAPHAQAGWSALVGKRFDLKPGYTWQKATADGAKYEVYSKRPDYLRPQCFAGRTGEEPYLYTEKDFENGTDIEWLYAFDEAERKLFIRDVSAKEDVAVIDLDGEEPDWSKAECGENFERCSHYAWYHNLLPKNSNLGTQTWLGNRPLEFHDAVAFIIDGKRYAATGCGRRMPIHGDPDDMWVATVKARNGHRKDVPVARITNRVYMPFDGVTWVYPPTKDNPSESMVSLCDGLEISQ